MMLVMPCALDAKHAVAVGCNQELLQSLTGRMDKWDEEDGRISDIFLQLVPYLRMYTQYVNNLNVAMTTLDECKRKSKQFVAFLDTKLKTTKGLDIGSFLIMPVQRIPRYVLLLKVFIVVACSAFCLYSMSNPYRGTAMSLCHT